MDKTTIFTKTAKGSGEAAGKSKSLGRDDRAILKEIDGHSSVEMLAQRCDLPQARLEERLTSLAAADFIRPFIAPDADDDPELDYSLVPVLDDVMGAVTISAFVRETERQAQQAAEDRLSQEMEQQARQAADAEAQREAEELERRRATVARIRQEALAKYRRDLEQRAQREAEEQRRLEAEEQARLAAQEEARRAAKEQARRDAEEQAQHEAEAHARRLAEEQARREAELEARREAEEEGRLLAERMRQEEEQRVRKEAALQAEREAREAEKRAAKARARAEADERARRKAEEKAQREERRRAERAARDAELQALQALQAQQEQQEAMEQALAVDAAIAYEPRQPAAWPADDTALLAVADAPSGLRSTLLPPTPPEDDDTDSLAGGLSVFGTESDFVPEPVLLGANREKHYRQPSRWAKPLALAVAATVAAGILLVPLLSFEDRRLDLQKEASSRIGQPVNIGKVRVAWLPVPHWRIENVAIGGNGQVKVRQVDAIPRLDTLFEDRIAYRSVMLDTPVLSEEALGWLLFDRTRKPFAAVEQVRARNARLATDRIALPAFDVDAVIGRDGNWTSMALDAAGRKLHIRLKPLGDALRIDLRAEAFGADAGAPFGGSVTFTEFTASGLATRDELDLSTINGALAGGFVTGAARLQWGENWTLGGTMKAQQLAVAAIAPQLFESGQLDGKATIAMEARAARDLFAAPRIKGELGVRNGALRGVNLADVVRGGPAGGRTPFSELDATFMQDRGRLQLRQVNLNAGLLTAGGAVDRDAAGKLSGRLTVDIKSSARQARGHVDLGGSAAQPRFE